MRCLFSREVEGRQGGVEPTGARTQSSSSGAKSAGKALKAFVTMAVRPGTFSGAEVAGA